MIWRKGRPKKWEASLRAYLQELEEAEYSEMYLQAIRRIVTHAFEYWQYKEPPLIDQKDIRNYLSQWPEGRNRIYQRTVLNGFLVFNKNHVIQEMRWRDPVDQRFNVRWLNKDQVIQLLSLEMSPLEEIVIKLALEMGLRRTEIGRILLEDINLETGILTVRGKGKKTRSVPFPPDFRNSINRWHVERARLLSIYPSRDVDHLIIVRYRGKLSNIKKTALDNIYTNISKRLGWKFSFHDLRRTWARTAWEIGIPTETIALILGHKDTKTTLMYIGANVDHAISCMKQMTIHRQEILEEVQRIKKKWKFPIIELKIAEA